jgi:valyl-tRNA synthetase
MNLPKAYDPKQYETTMYQLWEQSGAFEPKKRGGKTWSMVFPLPNANANIHLGHGLTNAVYDVVARYHRMKGDATLYLPGSDHAGFETQVVYEKQLAKEGKSRFDFSREELYDRIYDFVRDNRGKFESQFRRLGASCDWSRYTFTLDDHIVSRAYATFKKMWDDGLIYRGERLVNYCTFHGTAFADVEVAYKEVKGHLWHLRYPLVDGSGEVIVATTRPETMLGDTAVAVHPDDERYGGLVGKTVRLPLTDREVPIIADPFVDLEFGTGAVKITPAHDQNDYDCAKRHDLPMITVIDNEGKMTDVPEEFRGLPVLEARKAVVKALDKGGFLVKTEDHTHNVGHCYKCGTVIEPLLRDQWFIDMQPLAKRAIEVLQKDKVTFYPTSKRDQLVRYLEGLKDWNVSRQIAWGIPIPAFQNVDDPDDWIYDERVGEHTIEVDGKTYRRDPDVFDTWFSSSSWPYATLRYPDGADFKEFYPTNFLDTGGEILYPWVSRMIMLGLYVAGDVPFRDVYIHGYVMAEDGSKMSKSVGNVIDPQPVMDMYGSDAMRMGLLAGRSPAVNRGYDPRRVEEARNFCNKLWNIARYIGDKLGEDYQHTERVHAETNADAWVLTRLNAATTDITKALEEYRFAEGYDMLYHFVWDDVADWYIEASKTAENRSVLAYVLEHILKLAHPFAPFITEAIWQALPFTGDTMLIIQPWPTTVRADEKAAADFTELQAIITEARAVTKALGARGTKLYYTDVPFLAANAELIARMSGLSGVQEVEDGAGLHLTSTKYRCWLDIDPVLAQAHLTKLTEEKTAAEQHIAQLQARLANKSYVENAPKNIVADTRRGLQDALELRDRLDAEYKRFESLSAS